MTLDLIKNQINSLGEEIYSYQTEERFLNLLISVKLPLRNIVCNGLRLY